MAAETEGHSSDSDTLPVLLVGSQQTSTHPISVPLQISGKELSMESDVCATVSIVSETTHQNLLSEIPLCLATIMLRTYMGQPIATQGQTNCKG